MLPKARGAFRRGDRHHRRWPRLGSGDQLLVMLDFDLTTAVAAAWAAPHNPSACESEIAAQPPTLVVRAVFIALTSYLGFILLSSVGAAPKLPSKDIVWRGPRPVAIPEEASRGLIL